MHIERDEARRDGFQHPGLCAFLCLKTIVIELEAIKWEDSDDPQILFRKGQRSQQRHGGGPGLHCFCLCCLHNGSRSNIDLHSTDTKTMVSLRYRLIGAIHCQQYTDSRGIRNKTIKQRTTPTANESKMSQKHR